MFLFLNRSIRNLWAVFFLCFAAVFYAKPASSGVLVPVKCGAAILESTYELYHTTAAATLIRKICGDMDLNGSGAQGSNIYNELKRIADVDPTGQTPGTGEKNGACNSALIMLKEVMNDCRKYTPCSKNSGAIGIQRLTNICWMGFVTGPLTGQGGLAEYEGKVHEFALLADQCRKPLESQCAQKAMECPFEPKAKACGGAGGGPKNEDQLMTKCTEVIESPDNKYKLEKKSGVSGACLAKCINASREDDKSCKTETCSDKGTYCSH